MLRVASSALLPRAFFFRAAVLAAVAAVILTTLAGPLQADLTQRDRDPVVLTGTVLPALQGIAPSRIVAFRYDGGWVQIPVQVDERVVVDFGTVYDSTATGITTLSYADTSTYTGPDTDPTFDADDEIAFMARDAGAQSPGDAEPAGTVAGSGWELTLTDPLTGEVAYAYLFESDGSLDPGAGASYVFYTFDLLSGNYKETYNLMDGPNPENSVVKTTAYQVHFADRWIRDETCVTAGGTTGVDILDRHKALFSPGNCSRSEDTFSDGEGAFLVNKSGPVRAIRGYLGANSGPFTSRVHVFYDQREEIITDLRVHEIEGIMDYFDYSPAATGMTWFDDLNPAGVTVDGTPDAVTPGAFHWEMITGAQGTLAMAFLLDTDIPDPTYTTYYSDDTSPAYTQCTGDAYEYGASGLWVNHSIPNTDPSLGAAYTLHGVRFIAYGDANQDTSFAGTASRQALHPVTVTTAHYVPSTSAVGDDLGPGGRLAALSVEPNPARSRVWLRFTQPASGRFSAILFDVRGRRVARWVDGFWSEGVHRVSRNPSRLAAGVYLLRSVDATGAEHTVKLVVGRER